MRSGEGIGGAVSGPPPRKRNAKPVKKAGKAPAKRAGKAAAAAESMAERRPTAKAAAQKVLEQAETVVTNLLEKANAGNTQAAKFLFEFAGIKNGAGNADEAHAMRDSLISRIANRLKLGELMPELPGDEDEAA